MAELSQAPLIEAIFELRWGTVEQATGPGKDIQFTFSKSDEDLFLKQFATKGTENDFVIHERINEALPESMIPHVITNRYRQGDNKWPCYQAGLGLFTVNQVNDGYSWCTYKRDILRGLELLHEAHPVGLHMLPSIGVELRYQDGFVLDEGETTAQFLKDKMEVNFALHEDFLSLSKISGELQGSKIAFHLKISDPAGILLTSLDEAHINGRLGFVMTTTVRSADGLQPEFALNKLSDWLEKAHDIQKHAFDTLIKQTYARTFK